MSRSERGGKGPGFEYWSSRPGGRLISPNGGKHTKKATHKAERRFQIDEFDCEHEAVVTSVGSVIESGWLCTDCGMLFSEKPDGNE